MSLEIYFPIFLKLFKGRQDTIAQQLNNGGYTPLRGEILTQDYLYKHLEGFVTLGQYVLTSKNECHYLCIDLDTDKNNLKDYDFKDFNLKIKYLGQDLLRYSEFLKTEFKLSDDNILFEDSGGRGFHLWIFFSDPISGKELKKLDSIIFNNVKPQYANYEFFPKQAETTNLGNLIKLPLGIHNKYNRRSFFFEKNKNDFNPIDTIENNLVHLSKINPIKSSLITTKTQLVEVKENIINEPFHKEYKRNRDKEYIGSPTELISNCNALGSIHQKAVNNIPLSRKEAFYYSSSLLSLKNSEEFIKLTLKSSYQSKYDEAFTSKELDKIGKLFPVSCLKLKENNICKEYCSNDVVSFYNDKSTKSKHPASVLFKHKKVDRIIDLESLKDQITSVKNIEQAFIKLNKYNDQATLFHDIFEYKEFESQLNTNCRHISEILKNNDLIPLEGYNIFEYPKKMEENGEILFRKLAYSPIYDQIIIQSVFNYVGVILDDKLNDSSIGYRIDKSENSDDIFLDWRELYPKYRSEILGCLSNENAKYYVYCDIEQFYDKIQHDLLISQIQPFLDEFSFKKTKTHIQSYNYDPENLGYGLPQGPPYARILANFYLRHFDELCVEIANFYFRYVDDIFIFFSTEEDAKEGLETITKFLSENLGLSLSNSIGKEAQIKETAKNRHEILKNFRQAWYMQKNEFRQLEGSTIETIQAFYNKIDKDITHNFKEIEDINKDLYSFIYLTSDFIHYGISSDLVIHLKKCVPYLIEKNQFFPKDAKQVFKWLLKGYIFNNEEIIDLFSKLHNTHKIIMLFEIYRMVSNNNSHVELFKDILTFLINNDEPYIKAIAMVMLHQLGEFDYSKIIISSSDWLHNDFIKKLIPIPETLTHVRSNFDSLNFKTLSISAKKKIINLFSETFNNQPVYSDSLKIELLIGISSYLYLPELCNIYSQLKDQNTVWRFIEKKLTKENQRYKPFYIQLLKEQTTQYFMDYDSIKLKSQYDLYENIRDTELRDTLRRNIENIKPIDNTLEKIKKYNNSDYYKNKNENSFEEIINWNSVQNFLTINIDEFISLISEFSSKSIIPNTEISYESSHSTLRIKYINDKRRYIPFNENPDVSNNNILPLLVELYKNSIEIFNSLNRCPLLSIDNIYYDILDKSLVLRSVGATFDHSHTIHDKSFSPTLQKSIPQMIGRIIQEKCFIKELKDETSDIKYFLKYLMKRLLEDNPISYYRINYLTKKISSIKPNHIQESLELYLFERYKGILCTIQSEELSWYSFSQSLNIIYGIAKRNNIIPKHSDIIINFGYPNREMSVISKLLWKYQFLYTKLISSISQTYNVYQVFNLYSILSIETISLAKVILQVPIKENLEGCSILKYNNFEIEISPVKIKKIIILNKLVNNDDVILRNIDLDLIFISIALRLFNFEIQDNVIILNKNKKFKKYNELVSLLKSTIELNKNINLLGKELINQTLRNQDFNTVLNIDNNVINLKNSIVTIGIIRKSFKGHKRINTKKDSYNDLTLLNFKDYLNFPMTKQEELFKQRNIKTVDIKNNEIISIITPTNNLLELWKQIYSVNYKRIIVPIVFTLVWLLLTFLSLVEIKSTLLNFIISILVFIFGFFLDKILDRMIIVRKVYNFFGIKR